jgi:hypothetical protein
VRAPHAEPDFKHSNTGRRNLTADKSDDRERGYVVISTTLEQEANKYENCKVIPYGDVYPAIYRQVFGPASQRDCEKWTASNCAKSTKATS